MIFKLKNNKEVADVWKGMTIQPGAYYQIQTEAERIAYVSDSIKTFPDIASGDLIVNDGENDIDDPIAGWDYLVKAKVSVQLDEVHTGDGIPQFAIRKSYRDKSRSFTTPDYSNPCTWYFDKETITGEILNTSDDTTYSSGRDVTDWNHYWIDWKRIPNNARTDFPDLKLKVYKNDVLITSGFTVDCANGTVVFDTANQGTDVIKVDYCYGNSAKFELTPLAGKKLLVDYVEVQFSQGCSFNGDIPLFFRAIYNGPAIAPLGIPANYDVAVNNYEYYEADDFLNESTGTMVGEPFGRLAKKYLVLPWNYLTGHTLKPAGDVTTNLMDSEFNKLVVEQASNNIVGDCEIATCTFYCKIENL
jgi:hypothetical protein